MVGTTDEMHQQLSWLEGGPALVAEVVAADEVGSASESNHQDANDEAASTAEPGDHDLAAIQDDRLATVAVERQSVETAWIAERGAGPDPAGPVPVGRGVLLLRGLADRHVRDAEDHAG